MPLFEIRSADDLIPFRQLRGGAGLYERDIEDLFWANPEDFLGEPLFCVARQPTIGSGGRPDVIALDEDARVVAIEIKRDVDRDQLAQCLEYAGWARATSLDALARIYHLGQERFFQDWQDFMRSTSPTPINRAPRLVLLAREFDARTKSAFDFLIENGLPVKLVPVAIYEDQQGRKFVDIDAPHEPEFALGARTTVPEVSHAPEPFTLGRRVRLTDLMDAGLIGAGQRLVWAQPRLGRSHIAVVTENGAIELEDGRRFSSLSRAAAEASGSGGAYDGWECWRTDSAAGPLLAELRRKWADQTSSVPAS